MITFLFMPNVFILVDIFTSLVLYNVYVCCFDTYISSYSLNHFISPVLFISKVRRSSTSYFYLCGMIARISHGNAYLYIYERRYMLFYICLL